MWGAETLRRIVGLRVGCGGAGGFNRKGSFGGGTWEKNAAVPRECDA